MVQVLKQELREKILEVSKQEFLEKGFEKASMRSIAKKAECSLSNIYNYFENKDEIFYHVVKPTVDMLEKATKKINRMITKKKSLAYLNFDKSAVYFKTVINFVDENRDDLRLLAFLSHGSKMQNYVDDWTKNYAKLEYESLKIKAKGHKEILKQLPSKFFIGNLCGFFFGAVLELLKENKNREELEHNLEEIFAFIYQGWEYYIEF